MSAAIRRLCLLFATVTMAAGAACTTHRPHDDRQLAAQLRRLAKSYLANHDALDGRRLEQLRFVLDGHGTGGVNLRGALGTELLQLAVSVGASDAAPQARLRDKQLTLAQLAIAHGARAHDVLLGACGSCNVEPAFLALMLGAGADINASRPGTPALFNRVIETDDLAATERLIRLGADPITRFSGR
jgi:hypothetical protein